MTHHMPPRAGWDSGGEAGAFPRERDELPRTPPHSRSGLRYSKGTSVMATGTFSPLAIPGMGSGAHHRMHVARGLVAAGGAVRLVAFGSQRRGITEAATGCTSPGWSQ